MNIEELARQLASEDSQDSPAYPNYTDTDIFIAGFRAAIEHVLLNPDVLEGLRTTSMAMDFLKVTRAESVSAGYRDKMISGTYITFATVGICNKEDIFELKFKDKSHWFKVIGIRINTDSFVAIPEVTARETGYWCNKFDGMTSMNLTELIGLPVVRITDTKVLKQVSLESCWL